MVSPTDTVREGSDAAGLMGSAQSMAIFAPVSPAEGVSRSKQRKSKTILMVRQRLSLSNMILVPLLFPSVACITILGHNGGRFVQSCVLVQCDTFFGFGIVFRFTFSSSWAVR
jgi:hypothetical protein